MISSVSGKLRFARMVLVGLVLFFSQVYPHIHFHHDHDEVSTVDRGEMLADIGGSQHTHHSHGHESDTHETEDGHHHPGFNQHVDWHVVRWNSNSTIELVQLSSTALTGQSVAAAPVAHFRLSYESDRSPESVFPKAAQKRGPPRSHLVNSAS